MLFYGFTPDKLYVSTYICLCIDRSLFVGLAHQSIAIWVSLLCYRLINE